jgi:hypothetical protein
MNPLFSSCLVSSNPFLVGKLKSSFVRGLLLTRKLLNKGFIVVMLKSSPDRGLLLTRKLLNKGFIVE